MPKLAHVAHMAGWVAEPKLISADVFGNYCPRTDKGKSPDIMSTDDGGIGTDRGPLANMGMEVLIATWDGRPWVEHIGENHAGSQEHVIVAGNTAVDRDIVLDLDVVAEYHTWAHDDILAQIATFAQDGTRHNVAEVPDLATITNVAAWVDNGGFVCEVGHCSSCSIRLLI
jgi:hypothetical protein